MNELKDIYDDLRDLGFCNSQADFSRDWLGRSEGYFAYLKSSKEPVCLSAVGMLIGRLQSVCPTKDHSDCFEERMRFRIMITMAKTIFRGEWEIRNLPPHAWVTAI